MYSAYNLMYSILVINQSLVRTVNMNHACCTCTLFCVSIFHTLLTFSSLLLKLFNFETIVCSIFNAVMDQQITERLAQTMCVCMCK